MGEIVIKIIFFLLLIWGFRIIGFAFTRKFFDKLADNGYSLSASFGLILFSYSIWISSTIFKIPYSNLIIALLFILFLFGAVFHLYKSRNIQIQRNTLFLIQITEIIYLTVFFLFLIYRLYLPQINVIEDIMDIGIINSVIQGNQAPPQDIWYSNTPVNYYYFGHYMVGMVGKILNTPTSILYNLYISHLVATVFISIFGLAFTLCQKYFFSIFSALLVTIGGNLAILKNRLFERHKDFFYADARSLIPNTINEFPAYSFIISNLHAHILSLINVTAFLGIILSLLLNSGYLRSKAFILISAIILGSLLVTNSWDFVIYVPLLFVSVIIGKLDIKRIGFGILILFMSIALYIPFFFSFYNPTKGIGIVHDFTDPIAIIVMFGYFFWILATGVLFYKNLKNKRIILLFSTYGVFLILVPLFVFLKDIYFDLNPDYYRANTIFKVWYQAWILLSIVSGPILYGLFVQIKIWKNKLLIFQSLIGVIFLGYFVFYYPIHSYKYRIGTNDISSLDGIEYLEENDPGIKFIIDWLNDEETTQVNIVEGYGKSYGLDSIVSAYTGHPTIVGWYEHELGWRNNWPEIANRMGEVEKIYTSPNIEEVQSILSKYNIKYIVLGNRERTLFGDSAGQYLSQITQVVVSYDDQEVLLVN